MNKVCFLYIVTAGCTVGCMYNTNNVNVRGSASGEIRAGICCSKNCKLLCSVVVGKQAKRCKKPRDK